MRYSQFFNKKMQRTGHLWQNRFYSCVLDEPHLITAARYVERNPVRANIVKKPRQWKWSSALSHINQGNSLIKLNDLFSVIDMSHNSWKEYIDLNEDGRAEEKIRKHTLTGCPLGAPSFIEKLEKKFGRRFHALARGRPRRNQE